MHGLGYRRIEEVTRGLPTEEKGIRIIFNSYLTDNTVCFDEKGRQQQCSYIDYVLRFIWNTHTQPFCGEMFLMLGVMVVRVNCGI